MLRFAHVTRMLAACAGALAIALVGCVTALPASADTMPPDPATPVTVSSDGLPTVQIDGVAWQQVVVGNTVYVAGSFSTARPAGAAPGVNTVPRSNLLAYDIRTGNLITSWAPSLNAQALAITASPDGSRIYVGGDFTSVNGATVWRIAALDATTGALIPSFTPKPDAKVRAIVATASTVYFGGLFSSVGGTPRERLAAASATDGSLLGWAPSASGASGVNAMVISPDKSEVVVGGSFTTLDGSSSPGYGLGAVDATTGALLPFAVNSLVRDGGTEAAITSLSGDSDSVYGTGYVFGTGGNLEGTFRADWNGGTLVWVEDCHGDTYSSFPMGGAVYQASHKHFCGDIGGFPQPTPWVFHHATAMSKAATGTVTTNPYGGYYNFAGNPAPTLLDWFPDLDTGTYTGQGQGPWTVTGNSQYVVMGGEFIHANNDYSVTQQGLVRYAVPSIAPNKQGPVLTGSKIDLSATSLQAGTARVSWTANWDRDNTSLTYTLVRNSNTASPVYTTTLDSTFWQRPGMGFIDTGLTPGVQYRYRLSVSDPWGNVVKSDTTYVTISSAAPSTYANTVIAEQPSAFWRLGEPSGTSVYDWAGWNDALVTGTVTRGTPGAILGDADTATTFPGDGTGYVSTQTPAAPPTTFTLEAWINTTTTSGGKIIGFGNAATGSSSSYDRHVYMDNRGRIWFGVYPGGVRTLNSTASYNDGAWHHVVAELGPDGMTLYVDGKRVAQRTDVTSGQDYQGVWRVGGDNLNGWPSQPTSAYFAGAIDDVAVYPTELTATQVVDNYAASGRTVVNTPPTAAFTASVKKGIATLDGSTSTDPDGTITSYAWDFGDGSVGTGATATHTYATAGTYTVGLTVTDNAGATSTISHDVTVLPVLPAPLDAYGAAVYGSNPDLYWRLDESTGTTAVDASSSGNDGTYRSGVTLGQPGAIAGTSDTAASFDGVSGLLSSNASIQGPTTYTESLWFKTTTTNGGKLIGFGNAATGLSSNYDRHVYMETSGQLTFGTWTGQANTTTSPASYNDGQWHYMVATQSSDGMKLYVDGALVGTNAQTAAQSYVGYWRVGSDTTWGPQPYFAGTIDEVAVYNTVALPPQTIENLYTLGTTGGPANQPPTAAFTSSAAKLALSVDGSGSSDPDGSVASYAWSFGDGASGSGATASHTYAAAGTYTVTLTVTDNDGATGTVSHDVTVVANQPPTAAFTSAVTNLGVALDGSGSSDPDGTVASYAWAFGDGASGTGATASHTYAAAGTYTVTLTVTDNDGATGTVSHDVTVTAPTGPVTLASDAFARTVAGGFGTADVGGSWTTYGSASNFAVNGSAATMRMPSAGSGASAYLLDVASTESNLQVTMSLDKAATGGGTYVSLVGRRVGTTDYRGRIKVLATGQVQLQVGRGDTMLQTVTVPGITYTPGSRLTMRLEVTGTSPTTIQAKVWPAGSTEPTAWQASTTDTTAALQAAGSVGFLVYLTGTSTNAPVVATYDDLWVGTSASTPPGPNQAPTAAFTSAVTNLGVALDGSGSSDPDGTVASYAWTFGDGASGTGATASHTYAAAGTYTVTLTVTDNQGATGTVSHDVTVTAPVGPVTIAADAFTRSVTAGWGSADTGGTWTTTGTASGFSVAGGAGVMTVTRAGSGLAAFLDGVSSDETDVTVTMSSATIANGGGQYVSLVGRHTSTGDDYRAKVKVAANGSVMLYLTRVSAGAETTLVSGTVPGLTYLAGSGLHVRLQLTGTSPTTVRARVWLDGTTEPTTWQLTTTDSTVALQGPGTVGIVTYISGSSTNLPVVFGFDDFLATKGVTG